MFVNYLSLLVFSLTFASLTATFCSNLTSIDDKETPCFLEPPTKNPILLRTSGSTLVLPCHVARSKRSIVEWWYTDVQNSVNIKIYPVFPAVRPTVLRFITSLTPYSKHANETDILDASILLRHVNVDDSGTYRCVIRPWTMDPAEQAENLVANDDINTAALSYQVQMTGPRLCQLNPGTYPCFSAVRTSSPTIIDAYQTAFLQCVVKNHHPSVNVIWVVGDAAINSVVITNYLTTNQYQGDRLRRVFPLSPFDYSLELSVNRTTHERSYSCVIQGASDIETTLFTYIIRTIDTHPVEKKTTHKVEKVIPHAELTEEQVEELREEQKDAKEEKASEEKMTTTTTTTTTEATTTTTTTTTEKPSVETSTPEKDESEKEVEETSTSS